MSSLWVIAWWWSVRRPRDERGRDRASDTAKDKPQKANLAVGDGRSPSGKRRELQVKAGDQVLFTSYAGDEFKLEGDKRSAMRRDDILAVID